MNKITKTNWLVRGAVVAFIVLIMVLFYQGTKSRRYIGEVRQALQGDYASASRAYRGLGVGGFVYELKGALPEAKLLGCVEALGLTKYDPEEHGPANDLQVKDVGGDLRWWQETSGLDHYYFRDSLSDQFVVRVKWENGQVYILMVEPGHRSL